MFRISLSIAAVLMLSACTGSGTSTPTVPTEQITREPASLATATLPEACGRAVRVSAPPRGGAFQVPHCAGWSGTITYPSQVLRSIWSVTSSVTNDFGVPTPPSGVAIFYMQMHLIHPGAARFHSDGVDDMVTSPKFTSDHTYTLNVYHFYENDQCPSSQCTWTMNIGSPQPGSHSIVFASPLNGATAVSGGIPAAPIWQFVQD
jgi:hypothetical protein